MPRRGAALSAALTVALVAGGCGGRLGGAGSGAVTATVAGAATWAGPTASKRASRWTIEDLRKAEGRHLVAQSDGVGHAVTADMSSAEKALLERLLALPPGSSLKDDDLTGEHLRRVAMEGEYAYGLDGRFHRAMWRFVDARGRILGYRVHAQPKDLLSGKYVVAFYGPDTKLLLAQPVWY